MAGAPHGLADALKTLTVARYGRIEKFDSNADDAIATAIRITKQQQSAHSLVTEWGRNFSQVGRRSAQESVGLDGACVPGA